MLKISTKGQYALLIMTELAESEQDKFIPLKLLSHRHNLSTKYLEQILIQLSKSGLVIGLRGNNGGYKLAKKAEDYTVGEILRAMEGDLNPRSPSESNTLSSVGNDDFWNDFNDVINNFVDSNTLEHIAEKNRQFNGYDYCI
ncbi:MAG: Rrf2 family transcriptional regulator [Treponema sp.]|uniref:RrF2 family transcriptional regulator n=1 Tax=Treponema sp. TaxID=166 RepID=UPI0025DE084D|nr:Rrf2 family transcriptional regulator [Treponema sp.]MBQ8679733.1 Rrf2 family transcriptional regulator [Treponema sp.]